VPQRAVAGHGQPLRAAAGCAVQLDTHRLWTAGIRAAPADLVESVDRPDEQIGPTVVSSAAEPLMTVHEQMGPRVAPSAALMTLMTSMGPTVAVPAAELLMAVPDCPPPHLRR